MTQEKQNKHINPKTGDLESDCNHMNNIESTICYKDVSIVYITAGNPINPRFYRIGVVLDGEPEVSLNFILELGFRQWSGEISDYAIITFAYNTMLDYLKQALIFGHKVELCVNSVDPAGYRIIDVAIKSLSKNTITINPSNKEV